MAHSEHPVAMPMDKPWLTAGVIRVDGGQCSNGWIDQTFA